MIINTDCRILSKNYDFLMRLTGYIEKNGKRDYVDHRHSTALEFQYIIKGKGIFTIADKDYPIETGDVFFIRNNTRHAMIEIEQKMEFINILIEPKFIWDNGNQFDDNSYLLFLLDHENFTKIRYGSREEITGKLSHLIFEIERECREQKVNYISSIKSLLVIMFVELFRCSNGLNNNKSFKIKASIPAFISKSMSYIENNLTSELTLSSIAAQANLSENYYCNIFKKLNGVTPWEYIVSKRVDLAKSKLLSSGGTILDLAISCGFNNTANFNRAFKKYTGKTPTEYKKSKSYISFDGIIY
jgi:AraC-like DNA-binding protein